MAQSFVVSNGNTVTATPNSTTVPVVGGHGTAAAFIKLYEVNVGAEATTDNAGRFAVNRLSTAGTANVSLTQTNNDPNGGAGLCTWQLTYNIQPTVSAGSLLQWGQHMRGTYRWVAYDYTKMITAAVGTANGLALMNPLVTAVWNMDFSLMYEE